MAKIDDFTDKDIVQSSFDFWKYKEDKELIGVFERWENDNFGEHPVVISEDEEIHLPNLTALIGKFKAGKVVKGSKVKVLYEGTAKAKSGRVYENFTLFVRKK